jgi:flagellar motor switch protein FliN/FliY
VTDSLVRLAEATLVAASEAADALLGPGSAVPEGGSAEVVGNPFDGVELPAVVSDVSFDAGDAGALVLVLSHAGALRVAAALGAIDEEAAEFAGATLDDDALATIAQLAQRIAAGAAGARQADAVPGRTPARIAQIEADLRRGVPRGASTVRARATILGEPALLVQAIPAGAIRGVEPELEAPAVPSTPLGPALHDVDVRVWAELGRARMPTGEVVGLPSGAIVELDREAEEVVDLYVDGQRYAVGRLVVTDDDSWGVRIERVLGLS